LQVDADVRRRMVSALEAALDGAASNTVQVSPEARSLLGPRFDVDEPERAAESPSRGGRLLAYHQQRFGFGGREGLFIGRGLELPALPARWQGARRQRGQIVAVVGEPGIGKSRLLFEFGRTLGDEPLTRLEGRGESYGGGVPYRPVVDLLKRYLGIDERD